MRCGACRPTQVYEVLHDSADVERQGLAIRRFNRAVTPQVRLARLPLRRFVSLIAGFASHFAAVLICFVARRAVPLRRVVLLRSCLLC